MFLRFKLFRIIYLDIFAPLRTLYSILFIFSLVFAHSAKFVHLIHSEESHGVCDEFQDHFCHDENHHQCDLCDLISHNDALTEDQTIWDAEFSSLNVVPTRIQSCILSPQLTLRLRGPPVC